MKRLISDLLILAVVTFIFWGALALMAWPHGSPFARVVERMR